jgi:hypothetical protein
MTEPVTSDLIDAVLSMDGPMALERKRAVELRLSDIKNGKGPAPLYDERESLKRENEALSVRLAEWKEEQKAANARRNFAGIGSPFYEAVVDRFGADSMALAELERVALEKFDERVRKNAERKAAKKVGGAT